MGTNGTAGISIYSNSNGVSYDINYNQLLFDLLPKRYRQIKLFKYLASGFSGLYSFWNSLFLSYRDNTLSEIKINSQSIVLSFYIEQEFDLTGVYIENPVVSDLNTYLYQGGKLIDDEIDPSDLRNTYLYQGGFPETDENNSTSGLNTYLYQGGYPLRDELNNNDYDFYIMIPTIYSSIPTQPIIAYVNKYIIFGMTFEIVFY